MRRITWQEVRERCAEGEVLLIAHGKVYDAYRFLDFHPAGRATILRYNGTDCSHHFDFHSQDAQKLWKKFEVGRIVQGGGGACVIS